MAGSTATTSALSPVPPVPDHAPGTPQKNSNASEGAAPISSPPLPSDNNPHVTTGFSYVPPTTPKKNKGISVLQTSQSPGTYDPSIRGTPGGAGRAVAAAATGPAPAPPTSPTPPIDAVPVHLLWPNADRGRMLTLDDMATWQAERARHQIPTLPEDHAAARARHNYFVLNDGRDDRRDAGGFDAESYEGDSKKRKSYCDSAYEDLQRTAIALDRRTDSQTWIISYRPEAHPDNMAGIVGGQRVRNPLHLKLPLVHIPLALKFRGRVLNQWKPDVQDLKDHIRRVFVAPHVENWARRRDAAQLPGVLSGQNQPQGRVENFEGGARVPKRLARLRMPPRTVEAVLNALAHFQPAVALAALINEYDVDSYEAAMLVAAKEADRRDGLAPKLE
ncbi:hypothetical protein AURDEDRAFT_177881 [Auricularia subglabra TFB-10046 SS5]|uniref:Uncharacterized protein n=1 Tax=Auricularia subglabra (strain TFB-10046 / SS5) TaxID=717982 RepID=J0WMJ0_AURST|nr:hypothetical protein AURDEDRAFT_177881 [Auricularia subglabra TFB-10046 SS5]